MKHTQPTQDINQLFWCSDLHLDSASEWTKKRFLHDLRTSQYDAVLITGDISTSEHLIGHLKEISQACGTRKVFYLLGNHDYFNGSLAEVDDAVRNLSETHPNLVPLGHGEVIRLSRTTALVGHRGWFDGQSGSGEKTKVRSPDRYMIAEFKELSRKKFFQRLRELGEQSADYFRSVLPNALSRYQHVMVATHVPPFHQGVKYDGKGCLWNRQPFFINRAAGNAIAGIAKRFPRRRVTVCAGHSHSAVHARISKTVEIQVAGSRRGRPALHQVLALS